MKYYFLKSYFKVVLTYSKSDIFLNIEACSKERFLLLIIVFYF